MYVKRLIKHTYITTMTLTSLTAHLLLPLLVLQAIVSVQQCHWLWRMLCMVCSRLSPSTLNTDVLSLWCTVYPVTHTQTHTLYTNLIIIQWTLVNWTPGDCMLQNFIFHCNRSWHIKHTYNTKHTYKINWYTYTCVIHIIIGYFFSNLARGGLIKQCHVFAALNHLCQPERWCQLAWA